ncbi:DUF4101 domain-containing protein [Oculatella sp. LEGE 06141]|uniref:IMS domain-containing protein n=1 Tax=Oculatella sp. LEGE 06141 TaxID=1828648 RepID=UPI00188008CB|nr:DUF4101 domain-containing protein [Oculatella sp. LEGE 06141]
MKIPLDYYRILGLPIQSTTEQLQQAHRDRTLQLPRREFSEAAIVARKQLLDEAYAVLCDAEQRQAYDTSFLSKSYELEPNRPPEATLEGKTTGQATRDTLLDPLADPYTPNIEIQDHQLVGALLILLELGEYELVLRLGRPYLSSGSASLKNGRFGEPDIVLSDIVLTVALACLELGREQWQQGQYENAAESLETGQELLLREGIFASLRGEMQADLFKLRPYRILELVALPESHEAERQKGLALLQDMLQDRGGIDGTGDDQSGLSVDDFLRFIQQLRSYLTAAEQQVLFEAEARRPSAVATYLAVYALLARGFAQRQPALIRRAKLMLIRLGTRQDVHLEQAVCALLLGQTEEASRALELSQEYESLAFIREHSQGSPDLLPGLCLYGERWLQNEVFTHFRDLAKHQSSLKEYFADEQVQAYLEELPNEPEANQWAPTQSSVVYGQPASRRSPISVNNVRSAAAEQAANLPNYRNGSTATIEPPLNSNAATTTAMPAAERVSQLSPEGRLGNGDSGSGRRRHATGEAPTPTLDRARPSSATNLRVPPLDPTPSRRSGSGRRAPRLDRLLFLLALGVLGIGLFAVLANRTLSWLGGVVAPGPSLEGEQLQIQLDQPPVPIPDPAAQQAESTDPTAPLTETTAQAVIQSWLDAKSAAMGEEHNTEPLSQILTGAVLTQWQARAEEAQQRNEYWTYDYPKLEVTSVETSEDNPDAAQVEAEVTESSSSYQDGQPSSSAEDSLQVQYDLVREAGRWQIQSISASVLE